MLCVTELSECLEEYRAGHEVNEMRYVCMLDVRTARNARTKAKNAICALAAEIIVRRRLQEECQLNLRIVLYAY
jgi:hypothetical protein